ncbi:MAG: hypothetical protein U1E65_03355 [Myxococcota bacterium]
MRQIAPLLLLASACSGTGLPLGLDEPMVVRAGTFFEGTLPGSSSGPDDAPLRVTNIGLTNRVVEPGQGRKHVSGRARGASAVGLALHGLGRGYWVVPVGVPSVTEDNEPTFDVSIDFARTLPPGNQALDVVPFDAAGSAGVQGSQPLCVESLVPDNLAACDPAQTPPAAVISLSWDAAADLDLVVTGPDGMVQGQGLTSTTAPRLDRDSNAGCQIDGRQVENLIFPKPPQGTYGVTVRSPSLCGVDGARFVVEVWLRSDHHLERVQTGAGFFSALDLSPDDAPGLFVLSHDFGSGGSR